MSNLCITYQSVALQRYYAKSAGMNFMVFRR